MRLTAAGAASTGAGRRGSLRLRARLATDGPAEQAPRWLRLGCRRGASMASLARPPSLSRVLRLPAALAGGGPACELRRHSASSGSAACGAGSACSSRAGPALLHLARRRRGARLHALACARQNVLGVATARRGLRRRTALKRADRAFERQSLGLQHVRCRAAAVADDGGQHDRAVDLAAAPAARGRRGSLQNAPQVDRHARIAALARRSPAAAGWRDSADDVRSSSARHRCCSQPARARRPDPRTATRACARA